MQMRFCWVCTVVGALLALSLLVTLVEATRTSIIY
jgi:hypothetical protein